MQLHCIVSCAFVKVVLFCQFTSARMSALLTRANNQHFQIAPSNTPDISRARSCVVSIEVKTNRLKANRVNVRPERGDITSDCATRCRWCVNLIPCLAIAWVRARVRFSATVIRTMRQTVEFILQVTLEIFYV